MHRIHPCDVTQPLAARGGALVALAGLHQGEWDPLPSFLAWSGGRSPAHGSGRWCGRGLRDHHGIQDVGGVGGDRVGVGAAAAGVRDRQLRDGHPLTLLHFLSGLHGSCTLPGRPTTPGGLPRVGWSGC